ncbi:CLUMA_CG007386, isoform A [Clunio marinus]|uniref:CLUMA_CG007386, isoform A n=1 Tax=Clunio marinus TaxID=568069 RepID=A0A1J1I0X9_9DIPT|nr:CLUMA_CG007386, isoform A [Clunio marinus]
MAIKTENHHTLLGARHDFTAHSISLFIAIDCQRSSAIVKKAIVQSSRTNTITNRAIISGSNGLHNPTPRKDAQTQLKEH